MAKRENVPESRHVVPSTPETTEIVSGGMVGDLLIPTSKFCTGLDMTTPDGKRCYIRAKQAPDFTPDQMLNKSIEVQNFLLHEIELNDMATGELRKAIRYVLFLAGEKTLGGVSIGVVGSLGDIVQIYGRPPWDPPIKMELIAQKTRSKMTMNMLRVL